MRNKKLFEKVAREIEKHPEEYEQNQWICGTHACIAGHALIQSKDFVQGLDLASIGPVSYWGLRSWGSYDIPIFKTDADLHDMDWGFASKDATPRFWVRFTNGETYGAYQYDEIIEDMAIRNEAQELLGLEFDEAETLFHENWIPVGEMPVPTALRLLKESSISIDTVTEPRD